MKPARSRRRVPPLPLLDAPVTANLLPVKQRLSVMKRDRPQRDAAGELVFRHEVRRQLWQAVVAGLIVLGIGLLVWWQHGAGQEQQAPTQSCTIVKSFPHDPKAFCQGLLFHDGFLYEGTGNYGASSIRKVALETGKVLQQRKLDDELFGEGIALWEGQLIQLTWKNRTAIYYDRATLRERQRLNYQGEGWGLTQDGRQLIMSDGTATLRFIDPATFAVKRQVVVRDGNRRVNRLNELEYVDGEVYANIWYEDRIARISPTTGQVLAWINLASLWPEGERPHRDAVLNGIAYDAQHRRLFVTGKDWPKLFEIQITK
jgi:glutaminyl-peptide cyclotransferase